MKPKRLLLAVLAAALPLAGSAGEAQLLPAGEFAARDGRPGPGKRWTLDDARGAQLAAAINTVASRTPIVIDYDHQTIHAEKNGQKAPAAGWIRRAEWRPGQGLYATVEWTAAAKGHIDGGEYRYISPVITYDADGQVTGLLLAALLNYPAIVGMDAVIAELSGLPSPTDPLESSDMDLLTKICALFALAAGTTPEALMTHLTALKAQLDGTAALKAKLGLPETADLAALAGKIDALQATAGKPDVTATATIAALQRQLAALTAQINGDKVTGLVDQALKEGKLVPAMRDWAIELGRKDVTALQGYIDKAPALSIAAQQSGGKDPGAGGGAAALSATQADVIAKLGLTADQFKAAAPAAA